MKYQYKALISDFDNTLVGHDAVIPEIVVEKLKQLRKSGVIVSIATGRGYNGKISATTKLYPEIFDSPVVVSGGAEIVDPKTDRILWSEYIYKDNFQQIFNHFTEEGIYFFTEIGGTVYAPDGPKTLTAWGETLELAALADLKEDHVAKILVSASVSQYSLEKILKLEEYLNTNFPELHIIKIKSGDGFGLDITGKTSKHIGVLELMKVLKLQKEDVVAAGDSYNDYPLFTAVGTKAAMGDAPEELKLIADYIAPPQSENGILSIIEKYFL